MASEPLCQSTVLALLLPGVVAQMSGARIPYDAWSMDWDFLTGALPLIIKDDRLPGGGLGVLVVTEEQRRDGSYRESFSESVDRLIASYQGMVEYASWLPAA